VESPLVLSWPAGKPSQFLIVNCTGFGSCSKSGTSIGAKLPKAGETLQCGVSTSKLLNGVYVGTKTSGKYVCRAGIIVG
jgi:hypothetical protein